ncbi:hypothetical protein VP01_1940g2 [Puccinia sorghi]|uniref:Uncharacterized protein n=1 Tax=Puccinia sorghi TaxID=27349 RepID=A0A0L6VC89_9BASI|nr:hypothetical protein VP01_1940g2 [Puccinia sorghi]
MSLLRFLVFCKGDSTQFRQAMINVVLPSVLAKRPTNLGEERHGKLKTVQWYTLFAYIIPLNQAKFIMNTAYLMQCTHILFARKITGAQINCFERNYKMYNDLVASLFPKVKVQPNHHFPAHPQSNHSWGPLLRVAEFYGEHLIGFLQNINTNILIDKMNGTMMQRGCQLQRLMDKPAYKEMIQEEPTKGISYVKKINQVNQSNPENCVVAMIEGKVRYGIVNQIYQLQDCNHEGKKVIVLSPIANLFL